MRTLRRMWKRLTGSFTGGSQDTEMAAEFEAHIELMAEENRTPGGAA